MRLGYVRYVVKIENSVYQIRKCLLKSTVFFFKFPTTFLSSLITSDRYMYVRVKPGVAFLVFKGH